MVTPLAPEAAQAEERRQMAAALGIDDRSILCGLQRAGFSGDTIHLLHLVPFLAMVWANGVSRRDRDVMLSSLELRGLAHDSATYRWLEQWLTEQPSDEFFSASFRAIRVILARLAPSAQERAGRSVLDRCMELAQATGTVYGRGAHQ